MYMFTFLQLQQRLLADSVVKRFHICCLLENAHIILHQGNEITNTFGTADTLPTLAQYFSF
jgi:hypothetical protein